MTFLGVWSCQYRELRPITFGGTGRATTTQNRPVEPQQDDEGTEYGNGRRGRGRDGAGQYEMVPIAERGGA